MKSLPNQIGFCREAAGPLLLGDPDIVQVDVESPRIGGPSPEVQLPRRLGIEGLTLFALVELRQWHFDFVPFTVARILEVLLERHGGAVLGARAAPQPHRHARGIGGMLGVGDHDADRKAERVVGADVNACVLWPPAKPIPTHANPFGPLTVKTHGSPAVDPFAAGHAELCLARGLVVAVGPALSFAASGFSIPDHDFVAGGRGGAFSASRLTAAGGSLCAWWAQAAGAQRRSSGAEQCGP